ncbi:MAG: hypothetical protein OIN89_06095 [Candidatus Methanoperedens sp.]|nr:hypothetical protein [Candidatus Methanoperedens sp.]
MNTFLFACPLPHKPKHVYDGRNIIYSIRGDEIKHFLERLGIESVEMCYDGRC